MSAGAAADPRATTNAELRAALESVLAEHFGEPRSVAALERRPCPYRTSFALEEIDVELDGGDRLALVLKSLSRETLLVSARLKPVVVYDPLREIEVYRSLLADAGLGTATCFGSLVEPERERYWLFLERVEGDALWQVGELEVWQQVARWAAALHGRFADTGGHESARHLIRYDAGYYRLWLRRAQAFAREAQDALSGRAHGIDWLAARHDRLVERLLASPVTFIHGELYASNVLIAGASSEWRVCPIDWEVAAIGPGLMDLAALVAGSWSEDERKALIDEYAAAIGGQADSDELRVLLDHCRIHLAIRWLGWAPDWSPPREHSQDWLAEAIALAEEIDL
jgi:Phosphotransferase enzyme family